MEESDGNPLYSCRNCGNPLAFTADLLSKSYLAKSGQAYMFSHVMNVVLGQEEERQLLSGLYIIADIYCSKCNEELGWKYVEACERGQRYKEGNFILELSKIVTTHDDPE